VQPSEYLLASDPALLARLLSGALLLNPDVTTFWNMRREMLQASRLDMHRELHFTAVLLSRKPKCAEAFAHRKWVVRRLLLGA
jgi:protein prenyltransferase alpha subunit repeat containing protein 1